MLMLGKKYGTFREGVLKSSNGFLIIWMNHAITGAVAYFQSVCWEIVLDYIKNFLVCGCARVMRTMSTDVFTFNLSFFDEV